MQPILFEPVASPHRVPFDASFRIASASTEPPADAPPKSSRSAALEASVQRLDKLQHKLRAADRHAVLLVFQALDAAGKDGTIRAVLTGVDPAGCQVFAFKAPSAEELDHDFLWRVQRALPERGRIGVWNRSHYEDVLVARVDPRLLEGQRLPRLPQGEALWTERYESIRDAELHWARNGLVILKFFLHVSADEQRRRFLERLEDPDDNWKFAPGDLRVRDQRAAYLEAYERALNATSRPWAPWYAIPADSKSYMRCCVAQLVVDTLDRLGLAYPRLDAAASAGLDAMRAALRAE
jgi:PPK2 family polyphosphate:nucleotide phosphotransferase